MPLKKAKREVVASAILVILGTLGLSLCAVAQEVDAHMRADPAQALYRRSPFVHGYMHGYEDGFHIGNLELQLGRKAPSNKPFTLYRNRGYKPAYGNKRSFEHGYDEGYRRGYQDVRSGRAFRAVSQIRQAAVEMPADAPRQAEFDRALSAGYEAGRIEAQGRSFATPGDPCPEPPHSASFCDAYYRGFGLGYTNISAVRDMSRQETARARGSRANPKPNARY